MLACVLTHIGVCPNYHLRLSTRLVHVCPYTFLHQSDCECACVLQHECVCPYAFMCSSLRMNVFVLTHECVCPYACMCSSLRMQVCVLMYLCVCPYTFMYVSLRIYAYALTHKLNTFILIILDIVS